MAGKLIQLNIPVAGMRSGSLGHVCLDRTHKHVCSNELHGGINEEVRGEA